MKQFTNTYMNLFMILYSTPVEIHVKTIPFNILIKTKRTESNYIEGIWVAIVSKVLIEELIRNNLRRKASAQRRYLCANH